MVKNYFETLSAKSFLYKQHHFGNKQQVILDNSFLTFPIFKNVLVIHVNNYIFSQFFNQNTENTEYYLICS